MKHKRIRQEREVSSRGFSRWVNPTMNGYLLACCDCGLVHEMEFRAFKRGRVRKDGSYLIEILRPAAYGVRFRARRAPRYTARERARKSAR